METGRPEFTYSEELGDKICLEIATTNKGLHAICKMDGMPSYSTIWKWINDTEKGFKNKYARAKEEQMEFLAEEILDIADETSHDTITVNKNRTDIEIPNSEWINRSRLRVDARKWLMSKLAPKKFGDKLELENKHSGKIAIEQITGMEIK